MPSARALLLCHFPGWPHNGHVFILNVCVHILQAMDTTQPDGCLSNECTMCAVKCMLHCSLLSRRLDVHHCVTPTLKEHRVIEATLLPSSVFYKPLSCVYRYWQKPGAWGRMKQNETLDQDGIHKALLNMKSRWVWLVLVIYFSVILHTTTS